MITITPEQLKAHLEHFPTTAFSVESDNLLRLLTIAHLAAKTDPPLEDDDGDLSICKHCGEQAFGPIRHHPTCVGLRLRRELIALGLLTSSPLKEQTTEPEHP